MVSDLSRFARALVALALSLPEALLISFRFRVEAQIQLGPQAEQVKLPVVQVTL